MFKICFPTVQDCDSKTAGRKNIGLVLAGGFAKGAYHIGALEAIREYFDPKDFSFVSAASIGAFNAYAFVTEQLDKAKEVWESLTGRSVFSIMRSNFMDNLADMLAEGRILTPHFYLPLLNLNEKWLNYYDLVGCPLSVIKKYLAAAVRIPPVSKGIEVDKQILYDGGILDNIPVYPLLKKELDYIICVYFDNKYIFENDALDSRIIKISFPDEHFCRDSLLLSHESVARMIKDGYEKTKSTLSFAFSEGTEKHETVREKISVMDAEKSCRTYRITLDTAISNLNRLLRGKRNFESEGSPE